MLTLIAIIALVCWIGRKAKARPSAPAGELVSPTPSVWKQEAAKLALKGTAKVLSRVLK